MSCRKCELIQERGPALGIDVRGKVCLDCTHMFDPLATRYTVEPTQRCDECGCVVRNPWYQRCYNCRHRTQRVSA